MLSTCTALVCHSNGKHLLRAKHTCIFSCILIMIIFYISYKNADPVVRLMILIKVQLDLIIHLTALTTVVIGGICQMLHVQVILTTGTYRQDLQG